MVLEDPEGAPPKVLEAKESATHRPTTSYPALPWVIIGIVVMALSLRAPIIAPTAVIAEIQADTGLNAVGAGMLTGLPVLLFALATPLATRAIRRFGPEGTVILCLAGVLAGMVVRSAGPAAVVLAGTAIIGVAMTLGNIVVPVLIRRDVPWRRVSAVTGAYSAAMNVGSMATLLGTAPLAGLFDWRWAIAAWSIIAAAGLAYWLVWGRRPSLAGGAGSAATPAAGGQERTTADPHLADGPGAAAAASRNRRIVALLILAFCGQSGAYYATTTWLPLLLSETRGLGAAASGAAASLFQVAAIAGAFGVPLLAARTRTWIPVGVIGLFWIALPIGLLLAPEAYALWSIIGGIAQGGGFTAIFSIIPRISRSDAEAAAASAKVQSGGYLAATCAPPLAGLLNTATGGWTAPLLLILAATLAFAIGGLQAARKAERH